MSHVRRRSRLLLAGLLGSALWAAGEMENPLSDKIVFPLDQAVVAAGTYDLIGRSYDGDPLSLDGKTLAVESVEPPIRVCRQELSPGRHELRCGDAKASFVIADAAGKSDAPADWPTVRRHRIGDGEKRCGACHEVKAAGAKRTVGPLLDAGCNTCHSVGEQTAIHAHAMEPLAQCEMCHELHGSSRDKLLKGPKKQLCRLCHDT